MLKLRIMFFSLQLQFSFFFNFFFFSSVSSCNRSCYLIYFDPIMAVRVTAFWALASCSLVETNRRFGGTCRFNSSTLTTVIFLPVHTKGTVCDSSHLSMNPGRRLWAACCCRPSAEAAVLRNIRRWSHSKLSAVTPRRPLGTDRARSVTAGSLVWYTEAAERVATDDVNFPTAVFLLRALCFRQSV